MRDECAQDSTNDRQTDHPLLQKARAALGVLCHLAHEILVRNTLLAEQLREPLRLGVRLDSALLRVGVVGLPLLSARLGCGARLGNVECGRLESPCRAQINFEFHDQESLISRQCVASKAPEPGCRQSIRRRRRSSTCRPSRCCRIPQPRPAAAKTASKELSLAITTGLETPLRRRAL